MSKKGRVFSGARPTGRQHLGNYLGAIQNYVALQDDYDCIYCIVDVHALTTVETTQDLKQNTFEMMVDWLAAGIRPAESILFVQSHVPEVMELHTYLSMVTQIGVGTETIDEAASCLRRGTESRRRVQEVHVRPRHQQSRWSRTARETEDVHDIHFVALEDEARRDR